ncbi:MAG: hypothetical protein WCP16_20935 [Pseudanabaena sp. ELA645]
MDSDRPSQPTNPIVYFPHQTAIAPTPPKTRSPKSQHQTAIAPHHPKLDRLYLLASFELELGNVDLFYDLEIKYASIP